MILVERYAFKWPSFSKTYDTDKTASAGLDASGKLGKL
jgi:hypothetical protein